MLFYVVAEGILSIIILYYYKCPPSDATNSSIFNNILLNYCQKVNHYRVQFQITELLYIKVYKRKFQTDKKKYYVQILCFFNI